MASFLLENGLVTLLQQTMVYILYLKTILMITAIGLFILKNLMKQELRITISIPFQVPLKTFLAILNLITVVILLL